MQLAAVKIDKPETVNLILGQTHFIKSVEDIHEALVGAVPGIKFGLAFCEASGYCLVRCSGTDPAMIELAKNSADEQDAQSRSREPEFSIDRDKLHPRCGFVMKMRSAQRPR